MELMSNMHYVGPQMLNPGQSNSNAQKWTRGTGLAFQAPPCFLCLTPSAALKPEEMLIFCEISFVESLIGPSDHPGCEMDQAELPCSHTHSTKTRKATPWLEGSCPRVRTAETHSSKKLTKCGLKDIFFICYKNVKESCDYKIRYL